MALSADTPLSAIEKMVNGLGSKSCLTASLNGIITINDFLETTIRLPGIKMEKVKNQLKSLIGQTNHNHTHNHNHNHTNSNIQTKDTDTKQDEFCIVKNYTWFDRIMYIPLVSSPGVVRRVVVQELVCENNVGVQCKVKWFDGARWLTTKVSPQYLVHIWIMFQQDLFAEVKQEAWNPQKKYQAVILPDNEPFPVFDFTTDINDLSDKWIEVLSTIDNELSSMHAHWERIVTRKRGRQLNNPISS